MSFIWPHGLWLLLVLPALVGGAAWLARERARRIEPAAKELLEQAGRTRGLERWLPRLLLACALGLLLAAVARPSVVVALATASPTVILAIDVSGSMQADDIAPSRLGAAKAAARDFARALPEGARVGIVVFSDGAYLTLAPTANREAVIAATETLEPQLGTAIGYAILVSLGALFPQERFEVGQESASVGAGAPPAGADSGTAIVLLTDGQNTQGPSPADAALLAAQKGVRIYTVGIGTPAGRIHRGANDGLPVGIDEDALRTIATVTRAEYFYARTAPDLTRIYSSLGAKLALQKNAVEISALFCALGALALCASAGLSALRCGRVV